MRKRIGLNNDAQLSVKDAELFCKFLSEGKEIEIVSADTDTRFIVEIDKYPDTDMIITAYCKEFGTSERIKCTDFHLEHGILEVGHFVFETTEYED